MRDFLHLKFRQPAGFLFIFISVVNVESSLFRLPNCFGYGHFVELEGKSLFSVYLVVFWSQTGERSFIELFAISTGDETWVTIDTSDQTTLVPGNWESGVGPEFGSHGVRVDAVRAFETNDSFRVASNIQKLIGPVAFVCSVIVG